MKIELALRRGISNNCEYVIFKNINGIREELGVVRAAAYVSDQIILAKAREMYQRAIKLESDSNNTYSDKMYLIVVEEHVISDNSKQDAKNQ